MANGHGGKRRGAGKPTGTRWPSTLAKVAAREETRKLITAHLPAMVRAHVAHAIGIGHLYTRDKTGKFKKIEDQREVDRLLSAGVEGEHYWIFTKDPSSQSFTDLLNRALDKPKEQEWDVNVNADWEKLAARLASARQRDKARPKCR